MNDEPPTLQDSITHPPVPPLPRVLFPGEAELLADCEATMERHMRWAMEFNLALCAIRDKRLYRASFATMEEYCQVRWNLTARRVRQLVDASELAQRLVGEMRNVNPGSLSIPAGEYQMRALLKLPPEEQRAAWQEAVATAPNGKVTRRHVEQVVQKRCGTPATPVPVNGQNLSEPPVTQVPPVTPVPFTPGDDVHRPGLGNGNASPGVPLRPKETREARLIAKADRTIADLRDLLTECGTPDSEAAAELTQALERVEKFREHQTKLENLQSSRT